MKNLKKMRQKRGLSQKELADASGVSVRMIQNYEQGTNDINRAEVMTVYKLAEALNCDMEKLMEWDGERGI